MDVFFEKKKGHESNVFFREWTFFTNHGDESSDFYVKNRKKGYPIDFFSPENRVVLRELRLL